MKKILCSALLMAMLSASSAFAAGVGNAFATEELIGESTLVGMLGNGSRASVVANFVPEMANKFTDDLYGQHVAKLHQDFGTVTNLRLLSAVRGYEGNGYRFDRLQFIANSSAKGMMLADVAFVPVGKTFKIAAIGFAPAQMQQPAKK